MRKLAFIKIFLFFLILAVQINYVFGQNFGTTPLRECWRIEDENINGIQAASDNPFGVYLSNSDGFIAAIDQVTGQIIWKSEIGGEIIPHVITDSQNLFFISKKVSLTKLETETSEEFRLHSLSILTGITNWQKTFSTSNGSELFLLSDGESLFILTQKGSFFAVSKNNGGTELELQFNLDISTLPFLKDNKIYVGTTNKKVEVISAKNGQLVNTLNVPGIPKSVFINGTANLFIGDAAGNILAFDSKNLSLKWKTWTGAEITNITKVPKGVLVSSFDNYVYLISEKNGKRLWKKRLSGRSIGMPLIRDNVAVFSTFGGTDAVFIELNKGKSINRLLIEEENYFTNNPKGVDNLIFFPTQRGIFVYSTENSCQNKKEKAPPND